MNCEEWQCLGMMGLLGTVDELQYSKIVLEKLARKGFIKYIGDAIDRYTQPSVYQLTEHGLEFIKAVVDKKK